MTDGGREPTPATAASAERFRRADALLDAALDREAAERVAFVERACDGDDALRADVLRLLRAHERAGAFLDGPAAGLAAPLLERNARDALLARLQAALGSTYRIEREIGVGGMATVYLARDRKHDRPVALKLLNPELGAVLGVERFLAEIRVTAGLQHPNLLPLFDSGEAGGLLYYVMPFVAGESLRARLERERQLPVDEAVRIAVAVAGALDHAHRHGVVHRDLKPENILLHEGQPLLADFGIALAVSRAGGARLTHVGTSLGTPQYMSPEQAAGDRVVDARSDVYALACVLHEMLAGEAPHTGDTVQAVLAKLLSEVPRDVRLLRPSVPEPVAAAIQRALAKLPADRFTTVRDFASALAGTDVAPSAVAPMPRPGARRAGRRRQDPLPLALGAAALLGWAGVAWLAARDQAREPMDPARVVVPALGALPFGSAATLTPDGRDIVYADATDAGRAVFRRPVGELQTRAIPGTEGAVNAVVSPDGRWVAFHTVDDRLKKVPLEGGVPTTLARTFRFHRVHWASTGVMVTEMPGGLGWLPDSGGPIAPLTRVVPARGETGHLMPLVLPGDEAVVFTVSRERGGPAQPAGELAIASLDRRARPVVPTPLGLRASYAAAMVDGWLLYAGSDVGTLMAVRLDARRRRVVGTPVLVLQDREGAIEAATLGANGTLLYTRRRTPNAPVLVDAGGTTEPLLGGPGGTYMNPRFSPDGRRVAIQASTPQGNDVWLYDLASRTPTRLTTTGNALSPTWTPDGRRIVFLSTRSGSMAFWWQPADGGAPAEMLVEGAGVFAPQVSPDGRALVYQRQIDGVWSIWSAPLAGDRTPRVVVRERFDNYLPALSPDGRWLAYASNASGRHEVYVRAYPGPAAAVQISTEGGIEPRWAPDGRRLFYRGAGRIVAATVRARPTFEVLSRAPLLADRYDGDMPHTNYDVTPDGRRFVLVASDTAAGSAVVVVNWLTELRARLK